MREPSLDPNREMLSYLGLERAILAVLMSREGVQDAGGGGGGKGTYSDVQMTVALTSVVRTEIRNMVRFCMCPNQKKKRNTKFMEDQREKNQG